MILSKEQRAEISKKIITDSPVNSEKLNDQHDNAIENALNNDESNRSLFSTINSELTGYIYELRYITGYEKPALYEINYSNYDYYDSYLLDDIAKLEQPNIFFNNVTRTITNADPKYPEEYNSWKENRKCLSLNGSTDYATIPHDSTFNFDDNIDFSISVWIKSSNTGSLEYILTKGDSASSNVFRLNKSITDYLEFAIHDGANEVVLTSTNTINDDEYHHIAIVCDRDSTGYLYIDGTENDSADFSSVNNINSSNDLYIGSSQDGSANYFTGEIDDLTFYSILLAETDVRDIYHFREVEETNKLAEYKFQNNINDEISDNDGTLTNGNYVDGYVPYTYEYKFYPTENELSDLFLTIRSYYDSGGSGGSIPNSSIYGEYKTFKENTLDENQDYMTVGEAESWYMDPFLYTGDFILINSTDDENYAFGKIVKTKEYPSRILFKPLVEKGTIPDDASYTKTFTTGSAILLNVLENVILKYKEILEVNLYYLDNNSNNKKENNRKTKEFLNTTLDAFETWENDADKLETTAINTLLTTITNVRQNYFSTRKSYIEDYLYNNPDIYDKRYDIIKYRLNKSYGTLIKIAEAKYGFQEVINIEDKKDEITNWKKNYLIAKKIEKDGEFKRRVFIEDPDHDISEGDWVYIIADDEEEIYAKVDLIVNGRLEDNENIEIEEDDFSVPMKDMQKIFLKDVIITSDYSVNNYSRLVKLI